MSYVRPAHVQQMLGYVCYPSRMMFADCQTCFRIRGCFKNIPMRLRPATCHLIFRPSTAKSNFLFSSLRRSSFSVFFHLVASRTSLSTSLKRLHFTTSNTSTDPSLFLALLTLLCVLSPHGFSFRRIRQHDYEVSCGV